MGKTLHRTAADIEQIFLSNPLMALVKLARFKFVARLLRKSDRVLDLACGTGASSYFYSKFAQTVHGVDFKSDYRETWSAYAAGSLSFAEGDLLDPATYDRDFTVITMVDVIEHFSAEDGLRIIKMCRDGLKRNQPGGGGMLVLGTPSRYSKKYRAAHNRDHHLYEYEPDELQAVCDAYFARTLQFSMNDETVHTGFNKLAWFFFIVAFL